MSIAQKEVNETLYWLELLKETNYLSQDQYDSINKDGIEIIKLLTTIIINIKH